MRSIEHGLLRNNIVTLITREDGGRLETWMHDWKTCSDKRGLVNFVGHWGIGSFLIQFARSATAVDWASPGQASDQLVVGAWQWEEDACWSNGLFGADAVRLLSIPDKSTPCGYYILPIPLIHRKNASYLYKAKPVYSWSLGWEVNQDPMWLVRFFQNSGLDLEDLLASGHILGNWHLKGEFIFLGQS